MKDVELFGSKQCPYCRKAEDILKKHRIPYKWKEVAIVAGVKLPTGNFKEMERRSGGQTTVPQIFVDTKHYGDEDTLMADERSGKLATVFS
ncbi:glutaredoxin domain-containing protein [Pelagicoccus albus]|uniref:Glutathione S-transferase N-terminal domain-containing protein n=1 Tax=Pelagicoccus albus TaxID=415222 RepID=A0A7X1E988_9BACT|nr:glutaredoxin domain-containing protein [Pelagicoccus albus]MBC2607580.1 glutathione S-transferase N-terminal domain-containing protein [Pelagicoccus albus]